MKCHNVFIIQVLLVVLQNFQLAEPFSLKGFSTSNIGSSSRLDYVDNLIKELFGTVLDEKSKLEDPELWPEDFAAEFLRQGSMTFDYIVVGAGTAGSVVASRLSENPHISVLVIEAGSDPHILSEIHTLSLQLLNTPYSWNDYAEPNPTCCQAMKDERCYWPRGRMIGGTGGLNGNIFLPGHPDDFDEWQDQGNDGWSWYDIYPFYERVIQLSKKTTLSMGSLTLNHFQRLDNYHILNDLLINATDEVEMLLINKSRGYKSNILATVDRGIRMSTGKTYLGRVAPHRPNLYVMKNSVATKILFRNGNKATGVEFILNGSQKLRARARAEVIVSAGTFNTPKLLQLSGVGPAKHLKNFNIHVVKNLQVGQNLQDHGMMSMTFKLTKNIPDTKDDAGPLSIFDYLMYQKGPLASSSTLIGFINTMHQHKNKSDLMLVSHFSQPKKGSNVFEFLQFKEDLVDKFLDRVENQTVLVIQGLIIKTKSRGYVQLKSKDPLQGPLIYNNFASAEEDQQTLLRFIRFIQKLEKTSAFKYYGMQLVTIPIEECDGFLYNSNDYWLCYIKYFYVSAWHATGTCRMGPATDPSAVVDQRLRVHGVRGLRVIDASIMPNITSGNTNGPTIVIAEKAAQFIKEEWYNLL